MHHVPVSRNGPPARTLAGLAAAAIVSAVVPAAAGLAFLISLAARRPLIGVAAQRWPWLTGRQAGQPLHRTLTGLTAFWGIGLLAAAAVQLAGAFAGGLALTSPGGFTTRAAIALAVEGVLAAVTIAWLHRSAVPGPQAQGATPDPNSASS
jgi:hypothetical protein